MDKYDELIRSLENYRDRPNECDISVLKRTAEAIGVLQSVIVEKQKLLDGALGDLAKCGECKNCSNLSQCSVRSVERNLAYGGCGKWQWKGAEATEKAS